MFFGFAVSDLSPARFCSAFFTRRTGLAASLALLLTACAGPTPPLTPEQQQDALVHQLYRELAAGNFDACMDLVSRQSISDVEMEAFLGKVRHMLAGAKGKIDARGGLEKVEIVQRETVADGQRARVWAKVHYGDGGSRRERLDMILDQGVWKLRI